MIKFQAMVLYLRDYETFPVKVCLEAEPGSFIIDYDVIKGVSQVKVDLIIQKSDEEYFCHGVVRAKAELECVRCLDKFESDMKFKTDFIICSEAYHDQLKEEAEDDEDYVFCYGDEIKADIKETIRQAIILAAPMMPLCSENCAGLCPHCGNNRNHQDCQCKKEVFDERWRGLKDLQQEDN